MWHQTPSIELGLVMRCPYGSTVFEGGYFFIGDRIAGYIVHKLAAILSIGVEETQSVVMSK